MRHKGKCYTRQVGRCTGWSYIRNNFQTMQNEILKIIFISVVWPRLKKWLTLTGTRRNELVFWKIKSRFLDFWENFVFDQNSYIIYIRAWMEFSPMCAPKKYDERYWLTKHNTMNGKYLKNDVISKLRFWFWTIKLVKMYFFLSGGTYFQFHIVKK